MCKNMKYVLFKRYNCSSLMYLYLHREFEIKLYEIRSCFISFLIIIYISPFFFHKFFFLPHHYRIYPLKEIAYFRPPRPTVSLLFLSLSHTPPATQDSLHTRSLFLISKNARCSSCHTSYLPVLLIFLDWYFIFPLPSYFLNYFLSHLCLIQRRREG